MKNIQVNGRSVAIDGEHEFELGFCGREISQWKKRYMRKNSRHPAVIMLRLHMPTLSDDFWKYYLELHINNKMKSQTRIRKEAYDVLSRDKPEEQYGDIVFITLHRFQPAAKAAQQ